MTDLIPTFIRLIEDSKDNRQQAEIIGLFRIAYYHKCQQRLWRDYGHRKNDGLTSIVVDAYPYSEVVTLVATFDDGKKYEQVIEDGPSYFDIVSALQNMICEHSSIL